MQRPGSYNTINMLQTLPSLPLQKNILPLPEEWRRTLAMISQECRRLRDEKNGVGLWPRPNKPNCAQPIDTLPPRAKTLDVEKKVGIFPNVLRGQ